MKSFIASIALGLLLIAGASAQTPMFHQDVSWSPDGKYLAFTGMHDFDEQGWIGSDESGALEAAAVAESDKH